MTGWDLVSQALRIDAVRQSQLVAQASTLRRRASPRRAQLVEPDRGEDRCPQPSISIPGTEWQRAILGLGAAFMTGQQPPLEPQA